MRIKTPEMAQSNIIITCHDNKKSTKNEISNFLNNLSPVGDSNTDDGPCIEGRFTEDFINKQGNTMLWYAVYHYNDEVVKYLLKNKENYEFKEPTSSLYLYIKSKDDLAIDILSFKFTKNTYIFTTDHIDYLKDELDRTCIILYDKLKFCKNVRMAIINNKDYYGEYAFFDILEKEKWFKYKENTPLNQALFDNNEELVELLLKNGADPNINIANDTVNGLVYALFHGNYKLVALLMRYGANIYDKYMLIAKRMQILSSPETSGSMLPIFCECKTHDFNKTKEIFEYFIFIKRKTRIVALSREFDENSLFHTDYLCDDLFKLIISNVMIPDDKILAIREEKSWGSWLKSLFGY